MSSPMTTLTEPAFLIRVVLADDHQLVRCGIAYLLADIPGVEIRGEAANGLELIELVDELRPDLVITDLSMPGIDGFEAVSIIHDRYPEVRIIVLSMHEETDFVRRAVACGASGYIRKNAALSELGYALRSIRMGQKYFSPGISRALLTPPDPTASEMLSRRQLDVLKRVAQGLSSKEIAIELGISPKTVDVHRARIMETLDLRDVASLTRYALRNNVIKA